jgi:hypothetical protein
MPAICLARRSTVSYNQAKISKHKSQSTASRAELTTNNPKVMKASLMLPFVDAAKAILKF